MKTIVIICLLKSRKKTTLVICCARLQQEPFSMHIRKCHCTELLHFTLYKHLKSILYMHIIFVNEEMNNVRFCDRITCISLGLAKLQLAFHLKVFFLRNEQSQALI